MLERTCTNCTKCCEGWLSGDIYGHKMSPGSPCHFVELGIGCSIYTNRPISPCVNFKCEWLENPEVPDFLQPTSSGIVMVTKTLEQHQYLFATTTGNAFDENLLSWIIMYGVQKYTNIVWQLQSRELRFVGSREFMELANRTFNEGAGKYDPMV